MNEAELVLVTVKSGATAEAAAAIAAYAPASAVVIAFQNGVSNADTLAAALPGRTVLAGMVPYNVASPAPGHWHQGTEGALKVAGSCRTGHDLAPVFAAAGLPLERRTDMPAVLWGKLVVNLNNAVNAACRARRCGDSSVSATTAAAPHCASAKRCAYCGAAGIRPAKVIALPTWALPYLLRLPDRWYARLASRGARIDPRARSSMADDLAAGRRTEVDWLNGEVVRLAHEAGPGRPGQRAHCRAGA